MLVPPHDVGLAGVLEDVGGEGGAPWQEVGTCPGVSQGMTDTQLTVQCEGNVTCTSLNHQPGATIVSPILLSLSGVAGQIWALYYLYTTTRPQHSRTVFFVLLSTLIWTDLIGKIITTPPALIAYLHHEWKGGVGLCNFHGFSMMCISLVTHLLVSTMAVERYIGIRHGYFYNKNITTSRTKMLLLCIWLFSVLFCAMPLFGWGQYALQYPGSWCFVNIHVCSDTPLHHLIYTNIFGAFTIINLFIMVVCNVVVITTLLCLRLCRQRCAATKFCAPHRSSKQRELEMQMAIVLLVITIVFILSWSPLDLRLFLNQIWPHYTRQDHIQDLIAVRLTSINQIIDPWAYIICRKVFTTRAWRWLRMGRSWLLRRESSSAIPGGGGSRRRTSRPLTHVDKKIEYKGTFHGEDVVVVVVEAADGSRGEVVTCPPCPPCPVVSRASAVEAGDARDGGEAFRDSGTGSNNTPSTLCSGDSNGHNANAYPGGEGEGDNPIPVFRSQQYRVVPPIATTATPVPRHTATPAPRHTATPAPRHATTNRVRRICSSASARASSLRPPVDQLATEDAGLCVDGSMAGSRRHSWGCPLDGGEGKHYRTRSTQTFRHNLEVPGNTPERSGGDPRDYDGSEYEWQCKPHRHSDLFHYCDLDIGLVNQISQPDDLVPLTQFEPSECVVGMEDDDQVFIIPTPSLYPPAPSKGVADWAKGVADWASESVLPFVEDTSSPARLSYHATEGGGRTTRTTSDVRDSPLKQSAGASRW